MTFFKRATFAQQEKLAIISKLVSSLPRTNASSSNQIKSMAALYAAVAGVGVASVGIASLFREYEPLKCDSVIWRDLLDKTPEQKGKTVAITGTTSGTGLALAKGFAEKGAEVLMPVSYTHLTLPTKA